MKFFVFAFAVLFAGATAVPEAALSTLSNERFVDNIIINLIEDLSNDIVERGLDPWSLEKAEFEYKLPVTDLLIVEAAVADAMSTGLSNIKINRINFSLLTTRLQLDISLPLIFVKVESSNAYVKILNGELSGSVSGSFGIEEIRVVADVRVNVGIISGISIRSLSINFTINNIKSDLEINVFGHDLSDSINKFLSETVPNSLEEHREDINRLLEHIVREIAEELL